MINTLKYIKNNKDGFSFIDTIVGIIVVSMMLAFTLNVYPVLVQKNNLNNLANEIIREAELQGEIGDKLYQRIEELKKDNAVNPDKIIWDTTYINGTHKIQLNQVINVTLEKEAKIKFIDYLPFKVPLTSKATGRSEVYWK